MDDAKNTQPILSKHTLGSRGTGDSQRITASSCFHSKIWFPFSKMSKSEMFFFVDDKCFENFMFSTFILQLFYVTCNYQNKPVNVYKVYTCQLHLSFHYKEPMTAFKYYSQDRNSHTETEISVSSSDQNILHAR